MFARSRQLLRALARRGAAASASARLMHSHPLAGRATSVLPRAVSPFLARGGALRSMFIQTEPTPNPLSVKFLPGRAVLDDRFSTGVVRVACQSDVSMRDALTR